MKFVEFMQLIAQTKEKCCSEISSNANHGGCSWEICYDKSYRQYCVDDHCTPYTIENHLKRKTRDDINESCSRKKSNGKVRTLSSSMPTMVIENYTMVLC